MANKPTASPPYRLTARIVRIAPLIFALGFGESRGVTAQEPSRPDLREANTDHVARRIQSVSPTSGPPGTAVTLRTGGMPALTPVRIGMGATRMGFEELGQVLTNERGEFSLSVEVPAWARRDLTHIFIVFDFYFVPIAVSEVFHVTGSDGTVLRQGQMTDEGVECPALHGKDGVLYTLTGDVGDFDPGDSVIVEGTVAELSPCMQGTTIEVTRIRAGEGNP